MNRANADVGLKVREIEAALKVKINAELPSDKNVPVSTNRGNPAVLADPRSEFSKAIFALAKQIGPRMTSGAAKPVARKRRFRALAKAA
jgi:pilus assembly protein CpaE